MDVVAEVLMRPCHVLKREEADGDLCIRESEEARRQEKEG